MKVKTSITLDKDVVRAVERVAGKGESRSEVIERLLRQSLREQARRRIERRDLALINAHADELNAEADDVLSYQGDV
jgi:metal-responsive CopG/Arc/MetJ family transcriptional regulator